MAESRRWVWNMKICFLLKKGWFSYVRVFLKQECSILLMRHQERKGNSLFMLKNTFASVQFVMIWKTRRRTWRAFSGSTNLVFNIFCRYLTLNYIWTCRLASAAGMKPKTIRISLRNIFWEKCPSKRSIKKISSVYIKQIYSNGYCYKCFQVAFKLQKE